MPAMSALVVSLMGCQPDVIPDASTPSPALSTIEQGRPLTELASQAVGMAPTWLQQDLALSLRQLDDTLQDDLAQLIVDGDDPYLYDEVAFAIAHLSPEVLERSDFYPDLIQQNAEGIYARDADLAYVELVEVGEPGVGDWHTTTRYQVAVGETIETHELDRELYYWYIAHPRIEDEHPLFIDGFTACNSNTLECGTSPDAGMFWREFLWEGAEAECPDDDYCPVLRDHIQDATVLWDEEDPSTADGAIGSIISYMFLSDETNGRWLNFGAYDERSIQPNRIYGLGRGNCGEWADMTTALSRTALIPNVNVTPSSWDHTWNAFFAIDSENWTSEWIPWEPVNWWLVHGYDSTFSTYTTRGDGYSWHMSGDYTEAFTMEVVVTDPDGTPVDGAYVAVWSPYEEYWWYGGESVTGADGVASLELGAEQQYAIQIGAAGDYYPSEDMITYASKNVAAGQTDTIETTLENTLIPVLEWSEVEEPGSAVQLDVSIALDGARIVAPSYRFGERFTVQTEADGATAFVVDGENYDLLREGEAFEGIPVDGSASVGLPAEGEWFVVLPNPSNATALLGSMTIDLQPSDDSGWSESLTSGFELLAGDVVAVEIAF